jgi:hypothetical protein
MSGQRIQDNSGTQALPTSPAGQAIPPHPGPASTFSLTSASDPSGPSPAIRMTVSSNATVVGARCGAYDAKVGGRFEEREEKDEEEDERESVCGGPGGWVEVVGSDSVRAIMSAVGIIVVVAVSNLLMIDRNQIVMWGSNIMTHETVDMGQFNLIQSTP